MVYAYIAVIVTRLIAVISLLLTESISWNFLLLIAVTTIGSIYNMTITLSFIEKWSPGRIANALSISVLMWCVYMIIIQIFVFGYYMIGYFTDLEVAGVPI